MQYLIQVCGDVLDRQSKTYIVQANTRTQAEKDATQRFCDEFGTQEGDVCAKTSKRTYKAVAALVCMIIPIFLSLIDWKNGHETISISPDYLSCLYGAVFYVVFIVRFKGVQRTVSTLMDILFCVCSILLLASFIKTILVTKEFSLFGLVEIPIDTNIMLPIALAFSALGMKIVSLVCLAGVVVVALFNVIALNAAMGMICGPIYVLSALVGILLYFSVEPAFVESSMQFKLTVAKSVSYLGNDVLQARQKATKIKETVRNRTYTEQSEEKER